MSAALARQLAALDLGDAQDRTVEVTIHTSVDVDPDRELVRLATRTLHRAVRPAVRSVPLLLTNDGAPFPTPPRLSRVVGGSVGREVVDLADGIAVWELLLPWPLDVGETIVVEHELEVPRLGPDHLGLRCEQYLVRPVRETLLWVRFDPAALPASCEAYEREAGHTARVRRLEVDPGGGVHHSVTGFGPGVVGIRWEW